MSNDLTKKAAEMLLNGATLLSEPCPYCKGVRVMKDGNALCVNCGKKPEESYEVFDRMSHEPRIELFARTKREGWDSWGNEV